MLPFKEFFTPACLIAKIFVATAAAARFGDVYALVVAHAVAARGTAHWRVPTCLIESVTST